MGVRSSISSIKIKLFLAFFLLAVFVIAMVSYTLYAHMRTDHLNTLKNGMIKVVEIAAASTDGDTVKQINEHSGEDNPAYRKLKHFLRSIVEIGKGADQVFIIKKSDLTGQYIYLADIKADGAAEADFGDWLDTSGWSDFSGNIDKLAVYQSRVDEILALAPIFDSQGNVSAVLGIKSAPDKVGAEISRFGREIVKTAAKATLLVLSISWLLAYKFTQRIRRIDKAIKQITTGRLDISLKVDGADEIALLAANIEKMAATLSGEREEQLVAAVEALIAALEARDEYTYGHSSQVSELAQAIGRQLGMSAADLFELKIAALVHDIGKIGIPDMVLNKPGMLEVEEWSIIRQHPVIGAKILAGLPALKDVAVIVKHHHEAWNGQGYPDSIAGEEIPLAARIIAVADTFQAITTDRPYREGRSQKAAMAEIIRCADTQFDPEVVKALIRCFPL